MILVSDSDSEVTEGLVGTAIMQRKNVVYITNVYCLLKRKEERRRKRTVTRDIQFYSKSNANIYAIVYKVFTLTPEFIKHEQHFTFHSYKSTYYLKEAKILEEVIPYLCIRLSISIIFEITSLFIHQVLLI